MLLPKISRNERRQYLKIEENDIDIFCKILQRCLKKGTNVTFALTSNQRESRFSRILEIFFEISPLDLGLEVFQFHFHFSKRVKQKIISLFISRKEWKEYLFHFSFLEKSESISDFTLFLEKKEWNCACYSGFCHEKFKGIGNVEY